MVSAMVCDRVDKVTVTEGANTTFTGSSILNGQL